MPSTLGSLRESATGYNFFPAPPETLVTSRLVARIADAHRRHLDAIRICDVDPAVISVLNLAALDAELWRAFPQLTLADVARGRRSASVDLYSLHKGARVLRRCWMLRDSSPMPTLAMLAPVIRMRATETRRPLRFRMSEFDRKQQSRSTWAGLPTHMCKNYARAFFRCQLATEWAQRIAQAFLLSVSFLLAHPFNDGNGRISRAYFSTVTSFGRRSPVPLSINYFLQNGNHLYNEVFERLTSGDQAVVDYAGTCAARASELVIAAANVRVDRTLVQEAGSDAFARLVGVIGARYRLGTCPNSVQQSSALTLLDTIADGVSPLLYRALTPTRATMEAIR